MLKGSRFATSSLIVVLAVFAATGCKRDSDDTTIIAGNDIFTTDNFPGDSVQDGNVADDQRAMSPSGTTMISGSLRCTMNGDTCQAMITYTTTSDFAPEVGGLYAHHYDGDSWTPPVAIRALDVSSTFPTSTGDIIHGFINTEDHVSNDAQARDGDAFIVWRTNDVDDDGAGPDGVNTCVFVTYFDTSFRDDAARNYGFQEYASRVNVQEGVGEHVSTIALVTDGLCGEARWTSGGNSYSYGDPTTDVEIVFRQREDAAAPGANDDEALYSATLDLDSAIGEDFPLVPTGLLRLGVVGFGASDGGVDAEETQVDQILMSYNDLLVFRVFSDADFVAGPLAAGFLPFDGATLFTGSDVTLQAIDYTLGAAGPGPAQSLQAFAVDSLAGDPDDNNASLLFQDGNPLARRSCYGPDEGLAIKVLFFVQIDEEIGGDWANELNNARLTIMEIDEAGVLLEDAFLNVDDIDEDDNVTNTPVDTQISRNGDYIWVAWGSIFDITAGADNDGGTFGLSVEQYITTRPDDDGLFTVPFLVDTLSAQIIVGLPTVTEPVVGWFTFQDCLGYICGNQSDADTMHLFYEQSDGTSDEILNVRMVADLIPVAVSPVVTVGTWEVFDNGVHTSFFGFINTGGDFISSDSGEGGNVFTAYIEDFGPLAGIGNLDDDFHTVADKNGTGAAAGTIDHAVSFMQSPNDQLFTIVCTPAGDDIGVFDVVNLEDDDARFHPVHTVHVFFAEDRFSDTYTISGNALRTRACHLEDDTVSFGDQFVPNASVGTFEDPFTFDLPGHDTSDNTAIIGTGRNGDTVGVWFEFMRRLYYQEHSDSGNSHDEVGWEHEGDEGEEVSNPFLIDDQSLSEVSADDVIYFFTKSCTCDTLEGAIIFWSTKSDSEDSHDRLHVRVRNGDNN
jgi:hypothetical protein